MWIARQTTRTTTRNSLINKRLKMCKLLVFYFGLIVDKKENDSFINPTHYTSTNIFCIVSNSQEL